MTANNKECATRFVALNINVPFAGSHDRDSAKKRGNRYLMKLVLRLKEIVLARPRPFNVWNTGKQTKRGGATRLCAWRRCKNHFAPSCSRISQTHFARSCS